MTILYILFVLFFFGFCIFIHELGHLLAALKSGLHVEKFSIGFGPKLLGFKRNGVEYVLSAFPFGGYVALPQLEPVENPETSDGTVLPTAKPIARIVTAFAGPFANLIFGFFLAGILMLIGLERDAPQDKWLVNSVSQVAEPMPKVLGLKRGDVVTHLNETRVKGNWGTLWDEMTTEDLEANDGKVTVTVLRKPSFFGLLGKPVPTRLTATPSLNPEYVAGLRPGDQIIKIHGEPFSMNFEKFVHALTLDDNEVSLTVLRNGEIIDLPPYAPLKNPRLYGLPFPFLELDNDFLVGMTIPGSVAETAGLLAGDKILTVNDTPVLGSTHFTRLLTATGENPVAITVQRDTKHKNGTVTNETLTWNGLIPVPTYRIGVSLAVDADGNTGTCRIEAVNEDSPAADAGLEKGDLITGINGTEVTNQQELNKQIALSKGAPMTVTLVREGKDKTIVGLTAKPAKDRDGNIIHTIGVIPILPKELYNPSPWSQFTDVLARTSQTFKALFAGRVRPKQFSGPVGIFQMTYIQVTRNQFRGGLSFIVLITFSLAFFNLLPLPVLDGGHITVAIFELIFRRRVPVKLLEVVYTAFAVLLISFMLYVTVYDIGRVIDFAGWSERIKESDHEPAKVEATEPALPDTPEAPKAPETPEIPESPALPE